MEIEDYIKKRGDDIISPCTKQEISKELYPAPSVLNNIEAGIAAGVYTGEPTEEWTRRMQVKRNVEHTIIQAEAGNIQMMRLLGRSYHEGINELPKDDAKAQEWFDRANRAEIQKLRDTAEEGNGEAMRLLGHAYEEGRFGLDRNLAEAYRWYERASTAGDIFGSFFLGYQQIYGLGANKNPENGLLLLMSVASDDQPVDCACYFLGKIYYKGLSGRTIKSPKQAKYWFEKAIEIDGSENRSGYLKEGEKLYAHRCLEKLNRSRAIRGSAVVQPASNASLDAPNPPSAAAGASTFTPNATASTTVTSNEAPRGVRTSGRKRPRVEINYSEKAGDKAFRKILRDYQNDRPAPKRTKTLVNDSDDDGCDNVMV